jgi:hypothetical protein
MQYDIDILEVQKQALNEEYRSMKGDMILSSNYIHVNPFITPLPKDIGGYKIVLQWIGTMDDQFTGAKILEMEALQAVFILPEGENDDIQLQKVIALSQQAFAAEVSTFCAGTPLKDFRFEEMDFAEIADVIIAYIEKQ